MKVVENILELIRKNLMIKLKIPEEDVVIYAKIEYMNPSDSVKDRIARHTSVVAILLPDSTGRYYNTKLFKE